MSSASRGRSPRRSLQPAWSSPIGARRRWKRQCRAQPRSSDGLERWLAYFGTLGNNAPFIGLFGTVIGVIAAFEALGQHGAAQVASQLVMASIAEALVATAVGILVALPAVVAFNYFQRRVASLLTGTEVLSNLVLAYLAQTPGPTVRAMTPHPNENGIIAGINVTPLVDIMLVLLIVFMVTTTIMVTPAVPLDLPRASQSEELRVVLSVVLPERPARRS